MRLIELELTNIKSYEHEIIRFSEGINCILGLNGGGKTTIIESIGSVLFNSTVKTNNSLIRYKMNRGEISLIFEGNDNHIYKIVKTIKKDQACPIKLYDYENNQVLYEQVNNVYPFLKKVFNIPEEKNLPKLFEEIIAIPQGLFVNAFLATPRLRKENFDKLFELNIYAKTAEEVKKLCDTVQANYIVPIDKEIASLKGKVNNYDNIVKEINGLEEKINSDKESLDKIIIELTNLSKNKKNLDEKAKNINDLKDKHKEAETNKKSLEELLKHNQDNLNNAKEALKILKENEFAYITYQKNSNELRNNEEKYNEYIVITEKYNENKATISELSNANEILKPIIHDLKVDLGKKRQLVIDKTEDINNKSKENSSLRKELSPLIDELRNENLKSTEVQANYTFYLNKLDNINDYLLSYIRQESSEDLEKKIEDISNKLKDIENNKLQIKELELEKVKTTSDIDNLKINHDYISDGCCPILKQKCLNIKGSNLSTEVDKMLEEKQSLLSDINSRINTLISLNQNEDLLLRELELIKLEKNNHEREYEKYISVIDDIKVTFKEDIIDINEDNAKVVVSELIKKYQSLKENYKNERYEELKKQENKLNSQINSNDAQIIISKKTILELNEEIKKLESNINEKETQLNNNNFEIDKAKEQNEKYELDLHKYDGIKEKIEENKKVIAKLQPNYELYISKQSEASNKDKYELLANECIEKITKVKQDILSVEEKIQKLEKEFSLEEYNNIIKNIEKLNTDKSVLSTTINLNTSRHRVLKEEKKQHDEWFQEISNLETKLEKYKKLNEQYNLYRKIYTNLPRELSKRIRKYIGMYATNLYRGISNENVRIELEDDYEVLLNDCEDKDRTKTLSQLSGGEQMSIAISIRLAMLKQITNIEFYFMDEPTINLDSNRRSKVAEVVKDISSNLRQLFVISHDDTFEAITDNIIKIVKENNTSVIEN